MREMIYKKECQLEVLDKGEYAGRKYLILSLGFHPTAYVEVKGNEETLLSDGYDSPILDNVSVYYGFTFYGMRGNMGGDEGTKYLGWDYGHGNDFSGIYLREIFEADVNLKNLKKWTTAEIFEDVKSVIEQLNEVFETITIRTRAEKVD